MRLSEEASVRNLFSGEQHNRERQVKALAGHDGRKYVADVAALAIATVAQKASNRLGISDTEVRALARLSVEADAVVLEKFVNHVLVRGITVEQIYLQLFSPAMKLLGTMWESDELSFSRLSLACCRLQKVLFVLQEIPAKAALDRRVGRLFIAAVPGSQHTFGVQIMADIFRKNGWHVESDLSLNQTKIVKSLNFCDFDVIGFSIGSQTLMPNLEALISRVRNLSGKSTIPVMVGGPLFGTDVGVSRIEGVDYVSGNASESLKWANSKVRRIYEHVGPVT
jgi:MerR family transcriptional regulator, light-induced transcriptional regulator